MSKRRIAMTLLSVLLASGLGAAAHAADAAGAIVLSCPLDLAPPLRDFERLLGTTTFQSTANARVRVMQLARHACGRGALVVRVVAGAQPQAAFVQRDALDIARGLPVQ